MVDTRKKQTRKKQQSVTGKNAIHVEMWRFYLMWAVVLLVFRGTGGTCFLCANCEP